MPQRQPSIPWKERRERRHSTYDPKRKHKADRERHRRGKRSCFKKLNDFYLDAVESGRDCRVYAVILNKPKGQTCVRYTTYNSHPQEDWTPQAEEVAHHWPKADSWTPVNFKDDKRQAGTTMKSASTSQRRLFTLSTPPMLNLINTPTLG
ncbi:hypothetical protein BDV25DRAFT_158185 [Aspergillus avenaceus]|uniref:Uncharacterized protein n=1 Tax=Aspergillus avenaceus TaxID=36643 RepID=A0A5N6TQ69_ASPAV|nr:hypothetical protein BDV25DRAFT_158185 [Aspergillus avenaceus]